MSCVVVHKLRQCKATLVSGKVPEVPPHPKREKRRLLFHPNLDVVRKRNHAHCLPDAEANTRCHTTVETLDTVLFVDECESVQDRQLGRSVRVGSSLGH